MTFEFSDQDRVMDIHHFDEDGIYLGTEVDVVIKANEGLPAYSTDIDLPTLNADETCQMNEDETEWVVVEDHRGKEVHCKDGNVKDDYVVEEIGPIPDTHTHILRDNEFQTWNEIDSIWEDDASKLEDSIAQTKRATRNRFLQITDPMVSIPDFTIGDVLLTETQKTDLITWRAALKTMPTHIDWPNNDFPEPAQWIQDLATSIGLTLPTEWE